jgi:hypothetical protein
MRRLACTVVLVALASAGCIGSSNSGTSVGTTAHSALDLNTALTITYIAPTCPPGARCAFVPTGPKYYRVSRQLLCSPNGGDYDNPAAVCRALSDIVTKLGPQGSVCNCPPQILPPAKAVGYYDGKRQTIPLDGCSLCGVQGVGADLKLLFPQG